MYTPYLMFAYAVALALVLFGFRTVQCSLPGLRGIASLRRYALCDLGAVILLGLRGRAPLLVTEVVPHLLLFSGVAFLYLAVTQILELRPRLLPWAAGCCVAAGSMVAWFAYVRDSEVARLEIHCGVLALLLAFSATTLFGGAPLTLRTPARACAWLITVMMAVNVMWAAYGLIGRTPNYLHLDAIHAGFSYVVMILTLGDLSALGWLSFCVQRDELHTLAQTDALTGLLNRRAVEEVLRREIRRSERHRQKVSVILVDIDYFKQVNDQHGHLVGDDVLRRVGQLLRGGTRPFDIVGRFGGEEFVIVLDDATLAATEDIAERLRLEIASLNDLPRSITLTASFGVASGIPDESAPELLARADEALYRSKREGRNQVRVDGEMLDVGIHDRPRVKSSPVIATLH
ncbi:MAG TPA: GGDEF domain-containing protein [Terriglobales bacterium]|nr:GGDEF domain-containing protein [Terriglobales bacterium]